MFRLCYIIVCIAFPLSFLSCSSANLQISDCEINQETNFFVTEEIKKSEIDNLSGKRLAELKTRLIVQINTSLTSKSQLIQSVDGEISQDAFARIIRDGVVVYNGEILTLFREKNQVKEVGTGLECGISIKDYIDFKEKDVIESYLSEEIQRTI